MSDDLVSQGLVAGRPSPTSGAAAACDGVRALSLLRAVITAWDRWDAAEHEVFSDAVWSRRQIECERFLCAVEDARTVAGQADASPPSAAATVDPRLLKSEPTSEAARPAGCVCPVERVRREVRACPVHGGRHE